VKTIGVLGGISPQATMDFEARVHQAAQRLIPQHGNTGYPPLVVYYHRRPPFVLKDEFTPVQPLQADPALLQAADWLGVMSDFLVILANGAHLLQAQVERAAGCKVLSMIEVTLDEVRRRNWKRVGVLGFSDPKVIVYSEPLTQMGLSPVTLQPALQGPLNAAVQALAEGRATRESTQAARSAVDALRVCEVEGIILGCTEIPLLLGEGAEVSDLISPAQLLAEAAVKQALN
jgi:aspartate racemase